MAIRALLSWTLALSLGAAALAGCAHPGAPATGKTRQSTASAAKSHLPGQIGLIVQPEAGTAPIVQAIDTAEESVWLQIYILTDKDVIEALCRAADRDLDVRVLLEEHPYNPGNPNSALSTNQPTADLLKEHGVQVAWTNPSYNFTHAKTMIVDGDAAYVLTYNLTKAGVEGNREFGVIDRSPSDVNELVRLFQADYAHQPYRSLDQDVVVSPDNARWRILGLMERAKEELIVGVEVISDPEAMALLINKQRAGVRVRLLVGGFKKIPANQTPARTLINQGVEVRHQSKPFLHAKYAIADGKEAYVGSINLSTNSLDENRELGLIIREAGAISRLRDISAQDWEAAAAILSNDAPTAE
jgi:phosphatidylserine/phosphatidylglycerophosphate/cardiolipin synthase-like enzyme